MEKYPGWVLWQFYRPHLLKGLWRKGNQIQEKKVWKRQALDISSFLTNLFDFMLNKKKSTFTLSVKLVIVIHKCRHIFDLPRLDPYSLWLWVSYVKYVTAYQITKCFWRLTYQNSIGNDGRSLKNLGLSNEVEFFPSVFEQNWLTIDERLRSLNYDA